jgi:YtxH-like protein
MSVDGKGGIMGTKVKDWVRLGAKLSLLATDPKLYSEIGTGLKDRASDVSDTVASAYDEAVDRLENARAALRGQSRSSWSSSAAGFALGIGIGAGLGILFAPAAGSETRQAVRDKVSGVRNRVFEAAA